MYKFILSILSALAIALFSFLYVITDQQQFKTYSFLNKYSPPASEYVLNYLLSNNNIYAIRLLAKSKKDFNEKLELLEISAHQSQDSNEMLIIAQEYQTKKNFDKALTWYTKAAEKNNIIALLTLGKIYKEGKVVEKDLELSFKYYEQATKIDYSFSPLLLPFYEQGKAVERNLEKVYEIYYFSYANHVLSSAPSEKEYATLKKLINLSKVLNPEQVQNARKEALKQLSAIMKDTYK